MAESRRGLEGRDPRSGGRGRVGTWARGSRPQGVGNHNGVGGTRVLRTSTSWGKEGLRTSDPTRTRVRSVSPVWTKEELTHLVSIKLLAKSRPVIFPLDPLTSTSSKILVKNLFTWKQTPPTGVGRSEVHGLPHARRKSGSVHIPTRPPLRHGSELAPDPRSGPPQVDDRGHTPPPPHPTPSSHPVTQICIRHRTSTPLRRRSSPSS